MEASSKPSERRRRYERHKTLHPIAWTPLKRQFMRYVAEFEVISLPQLTALSGLAPKQARRHARDLFDGGFVENVAISRAVLADDGETNDARLLYGSAPNVYVLSKLGVRVAYEEGWTKSLTPPRRYGPQNSLFLAHELAIRDVRVWLERTAREREDWNLVRWEDGTEAYFDMKERDGNIVRPDAWFVLHLGDSKLVGIVEVDRGTERGDKRWKEKLQAYDNLYRSPCLKATTGYENARILTLTPTERRRDALANLIARHAKPDMTPRFWFADMKALQEPGFAYEGWRQAGEKSLSALLPPSAMCSNKN
ncbi:MAG: replication-relaxation family protein [Armatimonadetes bacterium]|nr:replication-relaxation family protein [Armatimonadota bacterium]